jgi:transcription elongation factor Elf1
MTSVKFTMCEKCHKPMRRKGTTRKQGVLIQHFECLTCGHKKEKKMS